MRGTAAFPGRKPEEIELAEPRCHHVSGRSADFRTCPFFATTAVTWPNRHAEWVVSERKPHSVFERALKFLGDSLIRDGQAEAVVEVVAGAAAGA